MRVAILAAAGRGERIQAGRPKALLELDGRTLLERVLAVLERVVDEIVVVHPPREEAAFAPLVGAHRLVPGGDTRSASVRAGVGALPERATLVAIHDAARALTPATIIERTFAAVCDDVVAAAPGLPVADTLKQVDEDATVLSTVDRAHLWAAHTPQVVRRDVLDAVFAWAGERDASDDLALVEGALAAGVVAGRVRLVRGDPRDLKVTFPEDLELAAALIRVGDG